MKGGREMWGGGAAEGAPLVLVRRWVGVLMLERAGTSGERIF